MGTCVEVEYSRDGSAEISVLVYALALMASRVKNGSVEVKQEASWSSAITDTDAHSDVLSGGVVGNGRTMSAAARKRIGEAQRKRWAMVKKTKPHYSERGG